jgi:hypothetical protein
MWEGGQWTWYPRVVDNHLSRPETMIREMPLAFPHPLDVQQLVTFNFPEDVDIEKATSVTESPAFRYEKVVDSNGRTVTIRQTLRSTRDSNAVKDVPDHQTKLNGIWSEIGYRLAPPGASGRQATAAASAMPEVKWAIGAVAGLFFLGFVGMLFSRRRDTSPAPPAARPAFLPGEAPASALAVGHSDDIDVHLAGRPCTCGARAYSLPDLQRARYADREMTIATRICGACGKEQSVYFTAA